MGRVTMSEQLQIANDKIERLVDEKNLLVVEANKRIQETADAGENRIAQLEAEYKDKVADLEKKLKDKESNYKYMNDSRNELQSQIAALQDILDVIPNVIPRRSEGDYNDKSPIVRLASVLAAKF